MNRYQETLCKYAQDLSTETVTPSSQTDSSTMDPSQLQPGQPIYSPEGDEFVVLNNPAGESQKVVMPSDQQGSQLPQGVTTLDDTELSTEYTLTSPSTETKIQSSLRPDVLQVLLEDAAREKAQTTEMARAGKDLGYGFCKVCGATIVNRCRCSSRVTHTVDSLMKGHGDLCFNGHQVSGDLAIDAAGRKVSFKKTAAEHMNLPSGYAKSISTGEGKKTETAGLRIGQEGYVDIMTSIQDMVEAGYDTVDVVLNIGELYPRDLGERVLEEARERGIL